MDANMSAITATNTSTSAWSIDPVHTVVEFKVRHMMISNVKGQFSKVTGALTLDEAALENSRVEGSIDAASLETRDAQRDAHLRSADFFDVDKFPALSFKSAKISLIGAGELAIEGELTIRDITRKVLFDVGGPTPRRGTPGAIPG
jgi:polyisoprenoid-binding protein YceI